MIDPETSTISTSAFARLHGYSLRHVRRSIATKQLPAERVGRYWRIPKHVAKRFERARRAEGTPR